MYLSNFCFKKKRTKPLIKQYLEYLPNGNAGKAFLSHLVQQRELMKGDSIGVSSHDLGTHDTEKGQRAFLTVA